jgi:hypothetical protein
MLKVLDRPRTEHKNRSAENGAPAKTRSWAVTRLLPRRLGHVAATRTGHGDRIGIRKIMRTTVTPIGADGTA